MPRVCNFTAEGFRSERQRFPSSSPTSRFELEVTVFQAPQNAWKNIVVDIHSRYAA